MNINNLARYLNICAQNKTCVGCDFKHEAATDCKTHLMLECSRALQEYADVLRYVCDRQKDFTMEQKSQKGSDRLLNICMACRKSVYDDNAGGWIVIRSNRYCPHCGMRMGMLKNAIYRQEREEN